VSYENDYLALIVVEILLCRFCETKDCNEKQEVAPKKGHKKSTSCWTDAFWI